MFAASFDRFANGRFFDPVSHLGVPFEQLQRNPANRIFLRKNLPVFAQQVFDLAQFFFNFMAVVERQHIGMLLGRCFDNRLQQFVNALSLAGHHRHNPRPKQLLHLL